MEDLLLQSRHIIEQVDYRYNRYLYHKINYKNRLIAIKGARGTGKTSLILQYIKNELNINQTVLYISMEDLYFYKNTLVQLANDFVLNGGQYLFLDEVHKYPDWAREIKLIYDKHKNLQIIFTSSSILEIYKAKYDLSRRAISYFLKELSLREFIAINSGIELPSYSFNEIIENHEEIVKDILKKIKPVYEFNNYITYGAYPYFIEGKNEYLQKLRNTINIIIENDIPAIFNIDFSSVHKIKKLLYAIATSVPFKPNISKLSELIGVTRPTLLTYLDYLEKAEIITQLWSYNKGIKTISKPEKIYLHNSNLIKALAEDNYNIGNIRETFFMNQVSVTEKVSYSEKTDFIVNNKFSFEIGGKSKSKKQINNINNAFVVKDNIEIGIGNIIPLWLFGFLY